MLTTWISSAQDHILCFENMEREKKIFYSLTMSSLNQDRKHCSHYNAHTVTISGEKLFLAEQIYILPTGAIEKRKQRQKRVKSQIWARASLEAKFSPHICSSRKIWLKFKLELTANFKGKIIQKPWRHPILYMGKIITRIAKALYYHYRLRAIRWV